MRVLVPSVALVLLHAACSGAGPRPAAAAQERPACPLETHVFLSLLHGRNVFVGNSSGSWGIRGRDVRYLGPRSAKPDATAPVR